MNDASGRGERMLGALEASVDRERMDDSEMNVSQRAETVKHTERFQTYLSGLSGIIDVDRSMRHLISLADPPRFLELLVRDCLKSREEIGYLKETLNEMARKIAMVNEKGKKGYRKLRKGIRNGLAGVTRRLERSIAERGVYSNPEVNDVYTDGVRQLHEYAKTMDAEIPSDYSSSYGSKLNFDEENWSDSDLDLGRPGPEKRTKKTPEEKHTSARKIVGVKGKKGKENGSVPKDLEPGIDIESISMTEVRNEGEKGDLDRSRNIKSVGKIWSPPKRGDFNLSRKPSEAIIRSGAPGLREEKSMDISYDKKTTKDKTDSAFGGDDQSENGKKPSPPQNMKWAVVADALAKDEERILGGIDVVQKADEILEWFKKEKEEERMKKLANKKKFSKK